MNASVKTEIFRDRGSLCHPPDFTVDDLVIDGDWHTLDLSGIIPQGVKAVYVQLLVKATEVGKIIRLRKDSSAGTLSTCVGRTIVANELLNIPVEMGVTPEQTLDYWIESSTWSNFSWRIRSWYF